MGYVLLTPNGAVIAAETCHEHPMSEMLDAMDDSGHTILAKIDKDEDTLRDFGLVQIHAEMALVSYGNRNVGIVFTCEYGWCASGEPANVVKRYSYTRPTATMICNMAISICANVGTHAPPSNERIIYGRKA